MCYYSHFLYICGDCGARRLFPDIWNIPLFQTICCVSLSCCFVLNSDIEAWLYIFRNTWQLSDPIRSLRTSVNKLYILLFANQIICVAFLVEVMVTCSGYGLQTEQNMFATTAAVLNKNIHVILQEAISRSCKLSTELLRDCRQFRNCCTTNKMDEHS